MSRTNNTDFINPNLTAIPAPNAAIMEELRQIKAAVKRIEQRQLRDKQQPDT